MARSLLPGFLIEDMYSPFKMPDFCARPEGKSKSLKDAYIYLRKQEFPDRNLFIFAQGEFNKFKGEILEQEPAAGEMIYPESKITLIAAVSGICHTMPDLFTDQRTDFLSANKDPRHGIKYLFAIFDSTFLKMHCRLEWIRDLYSGVYRSTRFIEYLNSIFFISGREADRFNFKSLGFILSRLSRFQGTEGALRVFFESATGLKVNTGISGNQKIPVPSGAVKGLGGETRLGDNLFVGDEFEGEKPELRLNLLLDGSQDVGRALKITEDREFLESIYRYVLPFYIKGCETLVDPESEGIEFESGKSYLGFNTSLSPAEYERG
ncbi:MAG: hypothetical protein JSU85_06605 [Candidatus Zixiibacteriota bacterium]|nr:MAG: hypothetical protein JSU85_06605 [candidate division Zixibacteria bacterium]